jgi:hypothetical protein
VAKKAGDALVEICWHVSRPGESATIALHELKRLYPPTSGEAKKGLYFFYGGMSNGKPRSMTGPW